MLHALTKTQCVGGKSNSNILETNQLFFRHISNFTKWLGALLIEVLAMKSSSKIKACSRFMNKMAVDH